MARIVRESVSLVDVKRLARSNNISLITVASNDQPNPVTNMENNDIFKKLRVALMLRDDQIEEILQLVDFRMSKGEIGNFFRNADHPKYVECGDQVLRNFLNGLVIYLRGTKEDPKNPMDTIAKNKQEAERFPKALNTKAAGTGTTGGAIVQKAFKKPAAKNTSKPNGSKPDFKAKAKSARAQSPVEKVKFNNGKKKK
jgi:hypothetical protein